MTTLADFPLTHAGKLSSLLIAKRVVSFYEAINYLATLPYCQLAHPQDLTTVISQAGGTFTARNAFLAQLAHEQGIAELSLTLCVQKFDGETYPEVNRILARYGLSDLPDMNGCLKYQGRLYTVAEGSLSVRCEVLSEVEIAPVQIGTFKRRYHQKYLENWLQMEGLSGKWSVAQVWHIYQKCLRAIEAHWKNHRRPVAV